MEPLRRSRLPAMGVSVVLHRYHGEDQQHNHNHFIFFLNNDGLH